MLFAVRDTDVRHSKMMLIISIFYSDYFTDLSFMMEWDKNEIFNGLRLQNIRKKPQENKWLKLIHMI